MTPSVYKMSPRYEEASAAAATAALAAANAATSAATAATYIANALACITNMKYDLIYQNSCTTCTSFISSCVAGASKAAAEAAAAAANAQAAAVIAAEVSKNAKPILSYDTDCDSGYGGSLCPPWTIANALTRLEASAAKDGPIAVPEYVTSPDEVPATNVLKRGVLTKHDKYRHVQTAYGAPTEILHFKTLITVRATRHQPVSRFSLVPEKYLRQLARRRYSRTPAPGDMAWGLLAVDEPDIGQPDDDKVETLALGPSPFHIPSKRKEERLISWSEIQSVYLSDL
ncbi:hypothetical protein BJX76DRAFT_360120 [Aspergillus varians]